MSVQVDPDFASDDRARAQIGAAVSYLLRDATGAAREHAVEMIIEIVRDVASRPADLEAASLQPLMSGVTLSTILALMLVEPPVLAGVEADIEAGVVVHEPQ